MEKVTKKQLQRKLQHQESRFDRLVSQLAIRGFDFNEPSEPKLKQLDQSVFDGLEENWRFAAVCGSGKAIAAKDRPETLTFGYFVEDGYLLIGTGYDTTNWQNSLIERDLAKELLEIDLSSELTGSDLCKAMIIGDRDWVLAYVSNENDATALFHKNAMVVTDFDLSEDAFYCRGENFDYAVPINNQGEPLTQAEAGL